MGPLPWKNFFGGEHCKGLVSQESCLLRPAARVSDCHVSQKIAVLMVRMDSFVGEREMNFVSLKTIRE